MRSTTALLLALVVAACSGAPVHVGPDPTPNVGVRIVAHVQGSWDIQALADQIPLTVLFKGQGQATLTGRPFPPFLTIDGAADVVVEPVGDQVEAQRLVSIGHVVILRAGVPGLLNVPGS